MAALAAAAVALPAGAAHASASGGTAVTGAALLAADPSNLLGVFAAAAGGDVIELASGDYGTFRGGVKPAQVTIRPAPGASATMKVDFSGVRNVRLEGLNIAGAQIDDGTRDVTIAGSRFTSVAVVRTSGVTGATIVLDGDRFDGLNLTPGAYDGRLSIIGSGEAQPVGVQIRNSHFGSGGCSDGVFVGGKPYGLQIGPGNEFSGVVQGSCSTHADAIQLYGSSHTQIVGNYLHDNDADIMAPDGGDHELIQDNVFAGSVGGYRPAIQLGSHDSSVFAHNTLTHLDVHMDSKSGASPSRNGVIRDNVFLDGGINAPSSMCSGCTVSYNLFSSAGRVAGTQVEVGAPWFAGGASPTSYAGFALAAGSPGKADASDGTDRGIRVTPPAPSPGGAPPPAAAAPPPAAPKPRTRRRHARVARLKVRHRITLRRLRRGLRVRVISKRRAHVVLRLRRKGSRHALVTRKRRMQKGSRKFVLRPRRSRIARFARYKHGHVRRLKLTVKVKPRGGRTIHLGAVIRVRR